MYHTERFRQELERRALICVKVPEEPAGQKTVIRPGCARQRRVSSVRVDLYPIVDTDACASKRVDPANLATWLWRAGVTLLQLRAKGWDAERTLALVQRMQANIPRDECRIVVNDRADIAFRAGCHGVHVGQGDLPIAEVRRIAPGVAVGISTHSVEQVNAALACKPDYVAIGPVFDTVSKRNPEPTVGVTCVRQASALCAEQGIPLVAIGGITPSNVGMVRAFCSYVAVIGAVTHDDEREVRAAVRALVG